MRLRQANSHGKNESRNHEDFNGGQNTVDDQDDQNKISSYGNQSPGASHLANVSSCHSTQDHGRTLRPRKKFSSSENMIVLNNSAESGIIEILQVVSQP